MGRLRQGAWLLMMVWGGKSAVAVQATLVADAHVNQALPAANSGTISNLYVGNGYTALLRFDLGTLPVGTTATQVSKAVLKVYCNRVDTAGQVSVQPVMGDWAEDSVTYATRPSLGSGQAASVTSAGIYLVVDVTGLVQGWMADPGTNHGVSLASASAAVQFDSKENDLTGHAAELEVDLASQGPQGLVGPQGPSGVAGLQGPQGVAGVQGPVGATGGVGPKGDKGDTGAVGPQGPAGPAGSGGGGLGSYQGAYSSVMNYVRGDVVAFQGSSYTSLVDSNQGNTPDVSAGDWGLLAQGGTGPAGAQGVQGPVGPQGPQGMSGPAGAQGPTGVAGPQGPAGTTGPMGATGPAGPAGAAGPTGAAGTAGLSYRGLYASNVNYGLNDAVTYMGSSYISVAASNAGHTPPASPEFWSLLAAQGAAGDVGLTGATGPTGPAGANGAAGAAGATGGTGPPGVVYRGAWNAGTEYRIGDAVVLDGTTYIAAATTSGLEPDMFPAAWGVLAKRGDEGATGPAGAAATVAVGTVTTAAAGTLASVTNSGTASAAVLNFTIPQGAAGTSGGGGGGGSGASMLSMYHAISFNFNFYSVSNTNMSVNEDASVLTWVPTACTVTSFSVFSQQTNTITATLRHGVPGAMTTALVCAPAPGSSCTATGSVPITAGSFLDVGVTGASGTPLGVWTAVSCN